MIPYVHEKHNGIDTSIPQADNTRAHKVKYFASWMSQNSQVDLNDLH